MVAAYSEDRGLFEKFYRFIGATDAINDISGANNRVSIEVVQMPEGDIQAMMLRVNIANDTDLFDGA